MPMRPTGPSDRIAALRDEPGAGQGGRATAHGAGVGATPENTRPRGRRFCLITCGNVSNRPRLLKAADALAGAGHSVSVIALDIDPGLTRRDDATIMGRAWRLRRLTMHRGTLGGTVRRAWGRGVQTAARGARRVGLRGHGIDDRALTRYLTPLARLAASDRADVVIAHGLEALPVAARAADRMRAHLGFDSEDLHAAELVMSSGTRHRIALIQAAEARYLRRCSYLTAASDGIADALVEAYRIARPIVVLNTFPWPERAPRQTPTAPRPGKLSLYWFSQVIGPGRGLEAAVAALGLLPPNVELHLRGRFDPPFVSELRARASAHGAGDRLYFWPDVDPESLIPLAAGHDVGLAPELSQPPNHDVCIANKVFVYLTAGLAIAASDTRGQRSVLERVPDAGFLFSPGDAQALAAGVLRLLQNPDILVRMKTAAAAAARDQFAWSHDAARLVAHLSGPGITPGRVGA